MSEMEIEYIGKDGNYLECIEIVDSQSKKKYYIAKHIKEQVWSRYIGDEKNESLCHSCRKQKVSKKTFCCGRVISYKNGGTITVENLRPICHACSLSIKNHNLLDFMKERGYF
jgi:hypothetical protein